MEFGNKVVGEVEITAYITEEDICNVMVTALEGGINYWGGIYNRGANWEDRPKGTPISEWATSIILKGKEVELFDIGHNEDDSEWKLTLEKLIAGIQMAVKNPDTVVDMDDLDADGADMIVQYALFKEIVFG